MKKLALYLVTLVIALVVYIGTMTILDLVMHDDWRILFISALPSLAVVYYVYANNDEHKQ